MIAPKIVLVLFFLTGIVSPNPVLNEQINSDAYRIKDSFKPTLYVITIDIRPMVIFTSNNNVITKASTVIFFDRLNKTDQVLEFHADTTYLKISDIYLSDGTSLGLSQCDRKTQICSVTLPKKLPDPDTDKFALTFVSNIKVSGDFQGLYKGRFDDPDNSGYFLATQFYPTYARRVFPCLDDPAFPAKFQFFIKADSYSHSVLTSTVNNDVFSQSPKMSTHSIGFVVMQLVPTGEKIDGDGTSHKVWTRPYVRQNGSFALYVAPKIMDEFGHYLGISYSSFGYNRSDEVAMPEINVGAIGNWGLTLMRMNYSSTIKNNLL